MQQELTMMAEIAKPESLNTTWVLYIFKYRFFKEHSFWKKPVLTQWFTFSHHLFSIRSLVFLAWFKNHSILEQVVLTLKLVSLSLNVQQLKNKEL